MGVRLIIDARCAAMHTETDRVIRKTKRDSERDKKSSNKNERTMREKRSQIYMNEEKYETNRTSE